MAGSSGCKMCGRAFAPYGRTHHVFCKRCTAKADREFARVLRVRCKECGKGFSTASRAVRYCSDACRAEGRRRRSREYMRSYMADPKRRAVISAQSRANYAARRGGEGRGGVWRRQQRADRGAGRRPAADAARGRIDCKLCGRAFAPYGNSHHSYCKPCTARTDRAAAAAPSVRCRECGKAFSPPRRTFRYCSDACRAANARRRSGEKERRFMADPENHARALARTRARSAAAGGPGGRGGMRRGRPRA